jgi:hypothetical protein
MDEQNIVGRISWTLNQQCYSKGKAKKSLNLTVYKYGPTTEGLLRNFSSVAYVSKAVVVTLFKGLNIETDLCRL